MHFLLTTVRSLQDFRSENGLYSLIQAQFDAAAKQVAQKIDTEATRDGAKEDLEDRDRPAKRRRASDAGSPKREEKEEADEARNRCNGKNEVKGTLKKMQKKLSKNGAGIRVTAASIVLYSAAVSLTSCDAPHRSATTLKSRVQLVADPSLFSFCPWRTSVVWAPTDCAAFPIKPLERPAGEVVLVAG